MTLPANGAAEAEFVMGRSDNAVWASELIAAPARPAAAARTPTSRAASTKPARSSRRTRCRAAGRSRLSDDGKRLDLTHRTPRPWAHVMANELGMSTMIVERRRGLLGLRQRPPERPDRLPLRQRDRRAAGADRLPARSRRQRDRFARLLPVPARGRRLRGRLRAGRRDFRQDAAATSTTEYVVFVPPGPAVRRPHPDAAQRRRPAEAFARRPVLRPGARGEPQRERRQDPRRDGRGDAVFPEPLQRLRARFRLRRDQPRRPATETIRTRFFGGPGRDIHTPALVETGAPDGVGRRRRPPGRGLCRRIISAPGAEAKFVVVFGQARSRAEALAAPAASRSRRRKPTSPRPAPRGRARLGKVDVRTNRPDFDRLVNTWLPYQLYASRLWGRVGPNQRGGATGYPRPVAGRHAAVADSSRG